MYKVIADAKAEQFNIRMNSEIKHISESAHSNIYPTTFLGREDVPFSAYKKSIEFSDELSKRTFW